MQAGAGRTHHQRISRAYLFAVGFLLVSWLTIGLPAKPVPAATVSPPSILGWTPSVSRNVPLNEPYTVYFNQAMDRGSVERAWRLTPLFPGRFTWAGAAVTFRPARSLKPGTYYRMSIGVGARSARGTGLQHTLSFAFSTGDALKVQSFSPAPGTSGVPSNGLVAITFNHPMVPLAGLSSGTRNPSGWRLLISPRTAGSGSWLGTSTWAFHPATGLLPSAHYIIRLAGSVRDAWGEALGRDLQWSFRTIVPEVVDESPSNGSRFVNPNGALKVTFNQPMNHASTQRSFSLLVGNSHVPGSISWRGETLVFHPSASLDSGAAYVARLNRGARSSNDKGSLRKSVSWRFHTSPLPALLSTSPRSGGTAYGDEVYDGGPGYWGAAVQLHFSAPMNKRSIDQRLTVTPSLSHLQTSIYGPNPRSRFVYTINGDFKPSTDYTIAVAAGAKDRFGRSISSAYSFSFKVARVAPSISLYGMPGGDAASFSSGHVIEAPIQFVNIPRVHYQLVKTTPETLLQGQNSGNFSPPDGTTIRKWTEAIDHPLNKVQDQTVRLTQKDGSPLAPGVYWLGAQTDANIPGWRPGWTEPPASFETLVVTNVSLTVKRGSTGALVWVDSAQTGEPLSGARIRLLSYQANTIGSALTDSNGLHFFAKVTNHSNFSAAVVSDKTHFGMTRDYWQPTLAAPPDPNTLLNGNYFGGPWPSYGPSSNGTYAYTDRPVYRTGQRVHFRAVLWRDHDAVYSRLGAKIAQVTGTDGQGRTVYQAKLKLDQLGTVQGQFLLPKNAPTGQGSVNISVLNSIYANAPYTIAEYRKPQFLTTVKTDAKRYFQGQTLIARVAVKYFFGAPVIRQQVSWVAYAQPRFTSPPGWDTYSFFNWDELWQQEMLNTSSADGQFGKIVAKGTGTTDDQGNLRIRWPVDISKFPEDQTLTIEARTTDASHQQVSGRIVLPIHKSSFAIGLVADQQVVPVGQQDKVKIAAVKQDGTPLANQSLSADIVHRTYSSQLVNINGVSEWKAVPRDSPFQTVDLKTDANGKAALTFTPDQGGEYRIHVQGKDELGNVAQNAISVDASVEGFSDWGQSENSAINLKPDKASYQVGDTAHILVPSPFAHATALVTLERRRIRMYRVEHLTSNSSTIDIPITLSDLPNVYLTVTLYRGWRSGSPPDWRYGATDLHVRIDPRHVIVQLTQNGKRHHPGDSMSYQVTTTDTQGRPVSAALSLALVDKSVLALQDEVNPDIVAALYSDRPLEVLTSSEGTILADHLTEKPDFPLNPQGPGMYRGQPRFAASLPVHAAASSLKTGGGGGGCGNVCPTPVRSRFADTGYWRGSVFTGPSGTAVLHLRLPDNTTTWRLDARAVSSNMQVGQASLETVTSRDIVLRPVVPRFFVQDDQVRLGAVVNNTLDHSVTVSTTLRASGLRVIGRQAAMINVPAHDERLVEWRARVPQRAFASLIFTASPNASGVTGDAVRISVPVHPPLTDETVATAGQVYGDIKQYVIVPRNAVAQPGSLWVQVSASLTAGLGAAFSQFRPNDHESNEDVANRLLVTSSLHSLPTSINGLSARTTASLPAVMNAAVRKLLNNQYGDGGWPWFNDSFQISDPAITADAVQALGASGIRWPSVRRAIDQGQRYLSQRLSSVSPRERAHLLFVLGETGKTPKHRSESLYNNSVKRSQLDAAGLADLGQALSLSRDPARARTVMSVLDARAVVSATGAHWENSAWTYFSQPIVPTTADVLGALLRLSPRDPLIPAAARWLMLARQGSGWDCPPDTAQAIFRLAQYARAAKEGQADYGFRVTVDDRSRLAGHYQGSNQRRARTTSVPVAGLHRERPSALVINRQSSAGVFGPGPLYYVARLRYYLPARAIAARNVGIGVGRQYLDLKGHATSTVVAGSIVRVKLAFDIPHTLMYLHVDDPIPAGFEPIDESLNTSQLGLFGPYGGRPFGTPGQASDLSWYVEHTDIRDDHVAVYAPYVPPGRYTYTYLAEASVPGNYGVAPTHASESFFPEVFGRSAGQTFTVK